MNIGNQTPISISDLIRIPKVLYDSTSNSIDISLMESTYKLLSPQIINNIRTSLNNIRLWILVNQ